MKLVTFLFEVLLMQTQAEPSPLHVLRCVSSNVINLVPTYSRTLTVDRLDRLGFLLASFAVVMDLLVCG